MYVDKIEIRVNLLAYKLTGLAIILYDLLIVLAGFIISTNWIINRHVIVGQIALILLVVISGFIMGIGIKLLHHGFKGPKHVRLYVFNKKDFTAEELDEDEVIVFSDKEHIFTVKDRNHKAYLDSIVANELYKFIA